MTTADVEIRKQFMERLRAVERAHFIDFDDANRVALWRVYYTKEPAERGNDVRLPIEVSGVLWHLGFFLFKGVQLSAENKMLLYGLLLALAHDGKPHIMAQLDKANVPNQEETFAVIQERIKTVARTIREGGAAALRLN
jgi:hypothetical protein